MEWKSFPQELPKDTGNYVASIKRSYSLGQYIFSDLAFYDSENKKWYRHDPFIDNYQHTEDITSMVVGWIYDLSAYFGTVTAN